MRWPTLITAIATIALAGSTACVGQLDTGGENNIEPTGPDAGSDEEPIEGTAREIYDENIHDLLRSACAACHASTGTDTLMFLGTGPEEEYYPSLVAEPSVTGEFNPALANLINKGEHELGLARAFTSDEKAVITEWLLAEAEERDLDQGPVDVGPDGPTSARDALAQFSACMTLDNWLASGIYNWADKGSQQGDCDSCHTEGAGGFLASDDPENMYEMNRYEVFIKAFFTTTIDTETGTHMVVPNYQKFISKADAAGHPNYTINPDPEQDTYLGYIMEFYDLTMLRMEDELCGPPGFPTP